MNRKPIYLLLLLLLAITAPLVMRAQADSLPCIDINRINFSRYIDQQCQSGFMPATQSLPQTFSQLRLTAGMRYQGKIPSEHVTEKEIIRFRLTNSADTALAVWFFPGFFYWETVLYREQGGELVPTAVTRLQDPDTCGSRLVALNGHDTATFYAEVRQVRTYNNTMRPRLVNERSWKAFLTNVRLSHDRNNMVTYLFCGLLLMMILFSMANYLQGSNKEFLYYSGYAFFLGSMLFGKALYDWRPNETGYFIEGYLDFVLQCIGHGFYMLFMRQFLAARGTRQVFLYRFYTGGALFLLFTILLFSYAHYFTSNYTLEYQVETISKLVLLGMTIVFLAYSIGRWHEKLFRYMFWGNFLLFIFSVLSQVSVMINSRFLPGILGSSLFYYEIGLFLELVCFFAALNYKNRRRLIMETRERERLRTENQLKEYEKELAVYKAQQEERQRISADMHDELGAGMTAIRLMSEIARNKMKESTPVEIDRISHSANEVLNKMNAIIWSMNSGNDTLDNLISYIRSYALEYFDGTHSECQVIVPAEIPARELTGDKRRNIFLCVKETLTNSLKHAKASQVTIEFVIGNELVITISDNGIGIDMANIRENGNGLLNIRRRMERIGGTYAIRNTGNGTATTLTLPL